MHTKLESLLTVGLSSMFFFGGGSGRERVPKEDKIYF